MTTRIGPIIYQTMEQGFKTLGEKNVSVSILAPNGESTDCSPYWMLKSGKKLLVTMPEVDISKNFFSNFCLKKLSRLAEGFKTYDIETLALVPNQAEELQECLKPLGVENFFILCDPENTISDALQITVSYEEGNTLKYPKAPNKLSICFEDGEIVGMDDVMLDQDDQEFYSKISQIFSKKAPFNNSSENRF